MVQLLHQEPYISGAGWCGSMMWASPKHPSSCTPQFAKDSYKYRGPSDPPASLSPWHSLEHPGHAQTAFASRIRQLDVDDGLDSVGARGFTALPQLPVGRSCNRRISSSKRTCARKGCEVNQTIRMGFRPAKKHKSTVYPFRKVVGSRQSQSHVPKFCRYRSHIAPTRGQLLRNCSTPKP